MKTTRALKEIDDSTAELKRLIADFKMDVMSSRVFAKKAEAIINKIASADIEV